MSRFAWPLVFVVGVLLASVGPAHADDRAGAREHFIKGTKAFDLGLYDDAIKEYMAAYQLRDDPALLYNIAQAHRLAGHPADAMRFYKVYLQKLPHAENRAEIESKMAELQKLIDQQKKTQSLPPDQPFKPDQTPKEVAQPPAETPPAPPPPSAPTPSAETAPAPGSAQVQEAPVEAPSRGRTLKLAGIGVAASGVALVAVGIAFGVLAKQNSDALSDINKNMGVFDASKESDGQLDQTLAGVFLGIGGAAAVGGTVMAIMGWRKGQTQENKAVSFTPVFSPRLAGASLRVRF